MTTVKACPECDRCVESNSTVHGNDKHRYRCPDCGHRTNDPVEREPNGHQNGLHGLAGKLYRGELSQE